MKNGIKLIDFDKLVVCSFLNSKSFAILEETYSYLSNSIDEISSIEDLYRILSEISDILKEYKTTNVLYGEITDPSEVYGYYSLDYRYNTLMYIIDSADKIIHRCEIEVVKSVLKSLVSDFEIFKMIAFQI